MPRVGHLSSFSFFSPNIVKKLLQLRIGNYSTFLSGFRGGRESLIGVYETLRGGEVLGIQLAFVGGEIFWREWPNV